MTNASSNVAVASGLDAGARTGVNARPGANAPVSGSAMGAAGSAADSDSDASAAPSAGANLDASTGVDGRVEPLDLEITETDIKAGDFEFHARVSGPVSGPVVLFLHGFPQTSYEWRGPMRALAELGYRAIAPNQRGFSPNARPVAVSDYTLEKLAGDAIAIADAVGATHFHLVGHDWGAAIAWAVAALKPERVTTLTTISVPHPSAFSEQLADPLSCQSSASSYFELFVSPGATDFLVDNNYAGLRIAFNGIPEADVEVYIKELGGRETIDSILNWYRANYGNRMLLGPPTGKVKVPTLFIWSDGDMTMCREGGELNRAYVEASYRFEVIVGANHWVMDLKPEEVSKLMLEHLKI